MEKNLLKIVRKRKWFGHAPDALRGTQFTWLTSLGGVHGGRTEGRQPISTGNCGQISGRRDMTIYSSLADGDDW